MSDEDLMKLVLTVGLRAIAKAVEAAERERCAAYLDSCGLWKTSVDIRAGAHEVLDKAKNT